MDNLLVASKAVFPIFVLLLIGAFVRRAKMFTESELSKINSFVFKIFFPFLMFTNIYNSDLSGSISPKLVIFGVIGVLGIYITAFIFICMTIKENRSRGAMIQAIYRSNYVLLGIPLVENICGNSAIGAAAFMAAIVVPMYNVIAVITLETFRGGVLNPKRILLQITKNPLIIGAVIGIISVVLKIQYPTAVMDIVNELSAVATPVAIIILGATVDFAAVKRCGKKAAVCIVCRLIAVPAVTMTVASLLGFRGDEFVILMIIFSTPCAVSSFTMAQQMDSDGTLAGTCVMLTSALSIFTIFLWILLFKGIGMF